MDDHDDASASGKQPLLLGEDSFREESDMVLRSEEGRIERMNNGEDEQQIKTINPHQELADLGLKNHLSLQRSNGLKSMIERIRNFVNN